MAGFDASANADTVAFRDPWVCNCRPAFCVDFEEDVGVGETFVDEDECLDQADGLLEYLVAIRAAVTFRRRALQG